MSFLITTLKKQLTTIGRLVRHSFLMCKRYEYKTIATEEAIVNFKGVITLCFTAMAAKHRLNVRPLPSVL